MERPEGKLKSLTLVEKLKLIEIVEMGRSVKDVAEEFAVNRNTLHYILKNREKIRESVIANPGISGYKRIKQTKSPELEQRILEYMYDSRTNNQKLSGSIIKTVALEIAADLGVDGFAASNGWLFSFFKRNRITISEFNKGVDQYEEDTLKEQKVSSISVAEDFEDNVPVDVIKTEQVYQKKEAEEVVEVGYEFLDSSNDLKEIFEEELVDAEDEEDDEVQESQWRNWCRICANTETLLELELEHAEIAQQLLHIAPDDIRICGECNIALEEISRMIARGRAVDGMFQELQERERTEALSSEEISDIRHDFGFETHTNSEIKEDYLEHDIEEQEKEEEEETDREETQEVIYEEVESSSAIEELELEPEDDLEYEVTEEPSELISNFGTLRNTKRSPDEDMFTYKCHICFEIFERMCFLANHTRTAHQSMPKVACTCGRFLSTWDSLMVHKRKHSADENNFACDLCGVTFRTKTGLSIHIKFKHDKPRKSHLCITCGRPFKDASVLKAHIRTHLPDEEKFAYECEICGKRMVNKWSLKYHVSTIHERAKNHFCHLCGRGFGNKSNLRSHLISHSTENVSCDICDGVFKNRVSLQSHKKIHKPKHLRKFSCETCNKMFLNRNHLLRHMVSHSDERGFKCPYPSCLNEYKWQKDLKNHMAGVHTGERPHKCLFCPRSFVDAANARKHRVKEHPVELAAFESQYGKGRRMTQHMPERMEFSYEETVE